MNYETDTINGHTAIVGHFFKPHEIQPRTRWIGSGGCIVTVEKVKCRHLQDNKNTPWYEVFYSWVENDVEKMHVKDQFSFQCRYFLIVEDNEN
jgi:hypothetical protein